MNCKSFITMFIALTVVTLFTVGCSSNEKNADNQQVVEPESNETSSDSQTKRVIKHLRGETTIIGEPSKIAVLDYRLADSMIALGTKPYAMTTYLGNTDLEYMEGNPLDGVVGLGDDINLEAILHAEPDLIIARQGHVEQFDSLNKIAPTIILEESANWRDDFRLFAEVLGKTQEADNWLKQYEDKVADAKSKIAPLIDSGKTAVVLRILPKEYRVYGTKQQLGGILYGDLGLQASESVEAIGKAEPISIETLPDFDADYIFVQVGFPVIGGDSDAEKNFEEMMDSSLWKNLKAVKNNHIFIVPYWTLRDFPIINEKTLEIVSQHILAE